MKFQLANRILLVAALAVGLCCGEQDPQADALRELRQLPEVALDRESEFQAEFRELKGRVAGTGLRRYGFAFRTPPLVDGPATWLVVWDHEKPDAATWEVTSENGITLAVVAPALDDLSRYPEFAGRFPNGRSVQRLRIPQDRLNKANRYQAILTTAAKTPPLGISINVAVAGKAGSAKGVARELKIPQGWIPSPLVMELVEELRALRGDAAAIEFLEAQFAQKSGRIGEFDVLFSKVWDEAQFGTGLDDPVWGSKLNDAAFTSGYQIGHYGQAFAIMGNLCARLSGAARFGRLAEVHAILEDAYRKDGLNMDPAAYPDRGPAIPSLPSVRHRDIPVTAPFSKSSPTGPPPISRVSAFDAKLAGAFLNYAYQRSLGADWHKGLEWTVWIRDWASDDAGNPIRDRADVWYSATFNMALQLNTRGYTEDALAMIESAVTAPYGLNYRKRSKISVSRFQLDLKREVGRPDAEMVPKLRDLVSQIENHIHFGKNGVWAVKTSLAKALFHEGQFQEGEALLDQIIREGSYDARWARLDRWLETGRTEGVEAELITLLRLTRENGHKIIELGLYRRYADFLESVGRFSEALAMRREAVRLAREFGGFTDLPEQLAKIAALLLKLGEEDLSAMAADEARRLMTDGNFSASTAEKIRKILAGMEPAAPATEDTDEQQPEIDLQPHLGKVIPLEGASWTSYLTLTNPGTAAVQGTLEISGAPLTTMVDEETGDIRIELVGGNPGGETALELNLAPTNYRVIHIATDAQDRGEGELKLVWRSNGDGGTDEARVLIDPREQGVAGAIIQAGNYQSNPFYGVPIHLSYAAKDQRTESSPLRFRASQVTRIEIHRLDGTPLAVDGTGNGSLLDQGDELFSGTDGAGNVLLGLTDGQAALRIMAYPEGPIGEGGLEIDIEAFDGNEWSLHSRNRIEH